MPPNWLPSNEELRQMIDTRAYCPWFLWSYVDIVSGRACVVWSRSDRQPMRESFGGLRLFACAEVPAWMIPP
jgi:hypothetical protein